MKIDTPPRPLNTEKITSDGVTRSNSHEPLHRLKDPIPTHIPVRCYWDLEVIMDNMNLMEDQYKLKQMICDRVERDFENRRNIAPVKNCENVLCVNEKMIRHIFGVSVTKVLPYIVSFYVVEKKQSVFVVDDFERSRRVMDEIRDPILYIEPLENKRGICSKVFGWWLEENV